MPDCPQSPYPERPPGCPPCDCYSAEEQALVRRPSMAFGDPRLQGGGSPWPWVVLAIFLGLPLISGLVWLLIVRGIVHGTALGKSDEGGRPPVEPIPSWAGIANTVLAYAHDGTKVHGYVLGHPHGMVSMRIRRVEGDWHEGRPKVDDIISVPPGALIKKSNI